MTPALLNSQVGVCVLQPLQAPHPQGISHQQLQGLRPKARLPSWVPRSPGLCIPEAHTLPFCPPRLHGQALPRAARQPPRNPAPSSPSAGPTVLGAARLPAKCVLESQPGLRQPAGPHLPRGLRVFASLAPPRGPLPRAWPRPAPTTRHPRLRPPHHPVRPACVSTLPPGPPASRYQAPSCSSGLRVAETGRAL